MKVKLGVLFGGVSPEHEVSVITGLQLMKQADQSKYQLIPIYVDKVGQWWTGENAARSEFFQQVDTYAPQGLASFSTELSELKKQLDVAILCFHGGGGEKGEVQGLLELAQIPYQGPGVTGSAVCFDKVVTRQVLAGENVSQTKYSWFTQADWDQNQAKVIGQVKQLGLPVYIKPANGGSTIGIQRLDQERKLEKAVGEVLQFDSKVLVEKEVTDCIEVNVSVLGDQLSAHASTPEQPIKSTELLTFADKYEQGGAKKTGLASASRRIPAPISAQLTKKLQDAALRLFKIFDLSGVVRIDFFANPSTEEIFVTELNTIPGSMSFYLWEASGLKYPQLIDRLVKIAQDRHKHQSALITTFKTDILQKNRV